MTRAPHLPNPPFLSATDLLVSSTPIIASTKSLCIFHLRLRVSPRLSLHDLSSGTPQLCHFFSRGPLNLSVWLFTCRTPWITTGLSRPRLARHRWAGPGWRRSNMHHPARSRSHLSRILRRSAIPYHQASTSLTVLFFGRPRTFILSPSTSSHKHAQPNKRGSKMNPASPICLSSRPARHSSQPPKFMKSLVCD